MTWPDDPNNPDNPDDIEPTWNAPPLAGDFANLRPSSPPRPPGGAAGRAPPDAGVGVGAGDDFGNFSEELVPPALRRQQSQQKRRTMTRVVLYSVVAASAAAVAALVLWSPWSTTPEPWDATRFSTQSGELPPGVKAVAPVAIGAPGAPASSPAAAQAPPAQPGAGGGNVTPAAPHDPTAIAQAPPLASGIDGGVSRAPASTTTPVGASLVRGVSDKEIRFGMSAAFSGANKESGRQMWLGIETAFHLVNDEGGIHGRKLKLIALDDAYEPERTKETMQTLYEKEKVFGFIGNYGTPTSLVAAPFALEHRMLFFGAFSGGKALRRDPPDRYVFNYRAAYGEEAAALVHYLVAVRHLRPEQIAVFAQRDSYGESGIEGVAKAVRSLPGADSRKILQLGYNRNSVDVDDAVSQLRTHKNPIKAVIMVATYRAAAKFIEKTRDLFPGMIYTTISGVGATALAEELTLLGQRYANSIIVTQVVPAVNSYASLVLSYKNALAHYFPGEAPDYVSLEGYIGAEILIEALKRTGPQLDTERLVDALESLHSFDMGLGAPVQFGRTEHQAIHKIWGTQLDATGHYHAIDLE